jgi:hypothetical protein
MPIKDVNFPVNTRNTGSKLRSNLPLSPGARSDPGRVGGPKFDSVPPQPTHRGTGVSPHAEEPVPGSPTIVSGPED